MFVDTSVIIAILAGEEDADEWLLRLKAGTGAITSPLVLLEAVMRLTSMTRLEPARVEMTIKAFLKEAGIEISPIDAPEGDLAIEAFARYGKGRGHPARLNLSGCLSYACARSRDVPLLYKGNDFAQTDLASDLA